MRNLIWTKKGWLRAKPRETHSWIWPCIIKNTVYYHLRSSAENVLWKASTRNLSKDRKSQEAGSVFDLQGSAQFLLLQSRLVYTDTLCCSCMLYSTGLSFNGLLKTAASPLSCLESRRQKATQEPHKSCWVDHSLSMQPLPHPTACLSDTLTQSLAPCTRI